MTRPRAWWPADRDLCRVCGLSHEEPGWAGEDSGPKYLICECCAAETGVDDVDEGTTQRYRAAWLARGALWFVDASRPPQWSALEQMTKAGIQVRRRDLRA